MIFSFRTHSSTIKTSRIAPLSDVCDVNVHKPTVEGWARPDHVTWAVPSYVSEEGSEVHWVVVGGTAMRGGDWSHLRLLFGLGLFVRTSYTIIKWHADIFPLISCFHVKFMVVPQFSRVEVVQDLLFSESVYSVSVIPPYVQNGQLQALLG